jgi:hypothetical protein
MIGATYLLHPSPAPGVTYKDILIFINGSVRASKIPPTRNYISLRAYEKE